MPIPDFLIVGAPKCGTTALHDFLAQHPTLHVPKKEYHHFGRDLRPADYVGDHWDRGNYEALFAEAEPGQLCGESSVWYLFSKTAAEEIYARNPEARIIIMLRNPVDLMYSLHNMFVWVRDLTPNGVIDAATGRVLSFEEALDSQEARKQKLARDGDERARLGKRELRLFHTDVAMLADQVARYLAVFPREQIHVVVHDDFRTDPEGTYRAVLRFLGVAETFTPAFERVNASRDIKNVTLHRLMNDHDALPALRRTLRMLVPRPLRKMMFRALKGANVQTRAQPPMQPATRDRLWEVFRDDIERLSELVGRDLVALWRPEETHAPQQAAREAS